MHRKSKRKLSGSRLLAVLIVAAVGMVPPLPAQRSPRPAKVKPAEPDRFLQGAPFQMSDILRMLEGIAAQAFREDRMIAGIRARGVDFIYTPEIEQVLKGAGASAVALEEIRLKAKPAPPPPPPQLGAVSVVCAPAECEVSVNGGTPQPTKDGQLLIQDLPVGNSVIDIGRNGYVGVQEKVTVTVGRTPLNVKLEPTPETRSGFGSAIFQSILTALGTTRDLNGYGDIAGSGTTTTTDGSGAVMEWTVEFRLTPPDLAQLQASNPSGSLTLLCHGEQCTSRSGGTRLPFGGKRLKPDESARLADNLHLFRRHQLREILEQLALPQTRFTAVAAPKAGEEQHFEARNGQERFEITATPEGWPSLVVFQSETSPISGSRYLFADYVSVGPVKYPKRTEIRMPGKQGIAVRFEKIDAGGGLKDKDFTVKGK